MPAPGEYKTVQARILLYAQEIGWTFVPRAEAEARRGFKPDGSMPADRARGASLFFNDTLYAQVKKLNPRFAGSMGDVTGRLNALKPDIFGNRDFRNKCGTRRSRPGGSSGVAVVRFAEQSLQTRPMKHWKDKAEFKGRILHWADKLGVRVRMATVRSMRNKWASCSTAGNLHFNAELLMLDRKVGDYVIVHELLHFSVPNHGRLWKSLMRAHLGDYENLARQLPTRDVRTD